MVHASAFVLQQHRFHTVFRVSSSYADVHDVNPFPNTALHARDSKRSDGIEFNVLHSESKPRPRKQWASALISLCISTNMMLGSFDSIGFQSNTAFAVETSPQKDNEVSQLSSWGGISSSDTLIKSFSAHNKYDPTASVANHKRRYWDTMANGNAEEISYANEKLLDSAVATINTMYYDSSGGFLFSQSNFYAQWNVFRHLANHDRDVNEEDRISIDIDTEDAFATRENAVKSLKWLVSSIKDPYSKYLTREELRQELEGGDDGFLGLGALVDVPSASEIETNNNFLSASSHTTNIDWNSMLKLDKAANRNKNGQWERIPVDQAIASILKGKSPMLAAQPKLRNNNDILAVNQAINLPVVKAIVPDSPAERAGIVVGDRIASVGTYQFTGMSRNQVRKALDEKFHAENYFGQADLTVAKPIVTRSSAEFENGMQEKYVFEDGWYHRRDSRQRWYDESESEQLLGYKLSHVKNIPTTLSAGPFRLEKTATPLELTESFGSLQQSTSLSDDTSSEPTIKSTTNPSVIGGDAIVHYELLTPNDSIFQNVGSKPVGYIRLTRFSKSSTAGYINAINSLEAAGANSYILDVRNNYGGVIQEAMLTASTLLRDPHQVLCYTLNSRGGFRPQENQEYITDKAYPGYFLSSEPRTVSIDQVRREHPEYLEDNGWSGPTSYASLRELKMTRGIRMAHVPRSDRYDSTSEDMKHSKEVDFAKLSEAISQSSQKKIVVLINEGTGESLATMLHAMSCYFLKANSIFSFCL